MTKRFIEGKTCTYAEIAEHTWSPHRGSHSVPPDTPFRYSLDPETGHGYFDEVTEPVNPLVSSERAQLHVEAMREDGMTYRQIACLAGVSVESVHRSASGVGRIRASTEDALVKVASSITNANGRKRGCG